MLVACFMLLCPRESEARYLRAQPNLQRAKCDAICSANAVAAIPSSAATPRSTRPDHRDVFDAAFGQPHLTRSSEDLPDRGTGARQRDRVEALACRIKAQHRVAAPVSAPHLVFVVDINGIHVRAVAGRFPRAPAFLSAAQRRVVHRQVAAVPLADPDAPPAARPDAASADRTSRDAHSVAQ